MAIKVTLQREAHAILLQMAKEAGVSVADMAEIACYNLIGLWQRDRAVGTQPLDASDGLDGANVVACTCPAECARHYNHPIGTEKNGYYRLSETEFLGEGIKRPNV